MSFSNNALLQSAVARLSVLTGESIPDLTSLSDNRLLQLQVVLLNALELGEGGTVSPAWGDITGKPSSFPPSTHDHDERYLTEAEVNDLLSALAAKALQYEIPFSFSSDATGRYIATRPVRLLSAQVGSNGSYAVQRALAASPASFSAVTYPQDIAVGDRVNVSVTGLTTGQSGVYNILAQVL